MNGSFYHHSSETHTHTHIYIYIYKEYIRKDISVCCFGLCPNGLKIKCYSDILLLVYLPYPKCRCLQDLFHRLHIDSVMPFRISSFDIMCHFTNKDLPKKHLVCHICHIKKYHYYYCYIIITHIVLCQQWLGSTIMEVWAWMSNCIPQDMNGCCY